MGKERGFSLIELLIVVAIILIIAAIAIPNLLKSRIAANEAAAVGALRTVITAEITYYATNPAAGYITLSGLGGAQMIDSTLASGAKSGYKFTDEVIKSSGSPLNDQFAAFAAPLSPGTSGARYFCSTEEGTLKYNMTTAFTTRAACRSEILVLQ